MPIPLTLFWLQMLRLGQCVCPFAKARRKEKSVIIFGSLYSSRRSEILRHSQGTLGHILVSSSPAGSSAQRFINVEAKKSRVWWRDKRMTEQNIKASKVYRGSPIIIVRGTASTPTHMFLVEIMEKPKLKRHTTILKTLNLSLSQILSSIVTLVLSGLTSRILTCTELKGHCSVCFSFWLRVLD